MSMNIFLFLTLNNKRQSQNFKNKIYMSDINHSALISSGLAFLSYMSFNHFFAQLTCNIQILFQYSNKQLFTMVFSDRDANIYQRL